MTPAEYFERKELQEATAVQLLKDIQGGEPLTALWPKLEDPGPEILY